MNTSINPDILARVQKLFATAAPDSGATEHERATAMRLATRYMDTHRITDQVLRDFAKANAPDAGFTKPDDLDVAVWGERFMDADGGLAQAVGIVVGCGVFWTWITVPKRRGDGQKVTKCYKAYGLPTDLAVGRELFVTMQKEMRAAAKRYLDAQGAVHGWRPGISSIDGKSFMRGYASALYHKAREEQKAREASTDTVAVEGTTALVVIGDAARAHQDALVVKGKTLGLGKGRSRSTRNSMGAHAAGAAAASRVSLSRTGVR